MGSCNTEERDVREKLARLLDHFRNKRIRLSEVPLECVHEGVSLRGRLYYGTKDWFCVLEAPILAFGPDAHMMAAAPARYVAPGQAPGEGVIGRALPGAEVLVETYEAALFENTP